MSRQMAAVESVTTVPEEDQKEKMCPSEENGVLNETSAPVDFSELTSSQFGISIQSFTPAPSSTRKGKVPKFHHWLLYVTNKSSKVQPFHCFVIT